MNDHIRVNLINVLIITLTAGLGIWAFTYILVWLRRSNWPVLSPTAQVALGIFGHAASSSTPPTGG